MNEYHVVSAKRMGWDNGDKSYEDFFFPADKYTRDSAMESFRRVKKDTLKNNHWYTYTAFEYEGEVFYSIEYRGIATEDELIREGVL